MFSKGANEISFTAKLLPLQQRDMSTIWRRRFFSRHALLYIFVLLTTDFLINQKYAHRRQKRSSAPQPQPSRTHKRGEYKIYQMEIWGTPPRAPQYCSH
jgi:hypothetical protein